VECGWPTNPDPGGHLYRHRPPHVASTARLQHT
jgi:hypothetical protein